MLASFIPKNQDIVTVIALFKIVAKGYIFPFALIASLLLASPAIARGPETVADIAENLENVVVNISTATIRKRKRDKKLPKIPKGSPFEDLFKDFFNSNGNGIPQKKVSSLGSGFVIGSTGLIVTNNHVIEEADEIFVTFHDGRKLKVERVVGRDKKTDIAVLQVKPVKPLEVVKFGDSKKIRVGDWVMAIGNPFGLGGTVTVGIVSAKNRDINSGPYDNFIQTDAAINKGNSGGPLFNMEGEVIGINTAIISPSGGSIGIGFAVPSATAKNIIEQLIESGRVRRGWLGVRIQSVSKGIAESLGLDGVKGALVSNITPGSPAEKAGLKLGDVILKFAGQNIATMRQLPKVVSRSRVNKDITVEYLRDGQKQSMVLQIEELKDVANQGEALITLPAKQDKQKEPFVQKRSILNMTVTSLTKKLRSRFHIGRDIQGVLVTNVVRGSIAHQKHIKKGNVVVEVSQKQVMTAKDVVQEVRKARLTGRKSVLLLISDPKGILRFIALPVLK